MKIILTGGGTAGHVSPNIALLPKLLEEGCEIHYIGGKDGIEKELIAAQSIPYHGISSGKLRRYADVKNFTDIFRVIKGLREASALMKKIQPDVVFSKGGFVTVPVVIAARRCGIPAVIHESDITPGLANRISMPFAKKVCVNFPETLTKIPKSKGVLTGTPIRSALFKGDRFTGARLCGFDGSEKPVVLFTGGSSGSAAINACVRSALPALLKRYRVIHLCGKGNRADINRPDYIQFEYVNEELPHLFALADLAVSRAGANTIYELLSLCKPHILIPLTREASRGDQILNAASFEKQGYSMVLWETAMTKETLTAAIDRLYNERKKYWTAMNRRAGGGPSEGIEKVAAVIKAAAKR